MLSGDRIKILRERDNLSQADLVKKLGLSRSSISMYEAHERIPSTNVYQAMADIFNVELDYIMARSDKTTVLPERLAYERRSHIGNPREEHLVATYRQRSDDGQTIVANTADGLHQSGKYTREESLPIGELEAVYSVAGAAAGAGHYNDGG